MSTLRERIIAEARSWIGTPYRHQASLKGMGCDCLGLVRGVWRALYGAEPELVPAYSPDWAEASGEEKLAAAARRHLIEIAPGDVQPGDLLLFRWRQHLPAKHAAILSAPGRMIHAYDGAAVAEVHFAPYWRRRLAFAFRFRVQPGSLPAAAQSAAELDGLLQVRACQRNRERTGWRGRLHRHNRPCHRVVANEFRERPRDWHQRDCARVGPVWVCER